MQSRYNNAQDPGQKALMADTILALAESMPTCVGKGSNSSSNTEFINGIHIEVMRIKLNELFNQYYEEKGGENEFPVVFGLVDNGHGGR